MEENLIYDRDTSREVCLLEQLWQKKVRIRRCTPPRPQRKLGSLVVHLRDRDLGVQAFDEFCRGIQNTR